MAPEQFDGLVALMRAIANSEARYPSEQPDADQVADRVRAMFVEEDETPAPVEERRVWQHRIHTACGSACKFGVVDNHGTWWHEQRSGHVYLWTTLSQRAAKRKASELNARETA